RLHMQVSLEAIQISFNLFAINHFEVFKPASDDSDLARQKCFQGVEGYRFGVAVDIFIGNIRVVQVNQTPRKATHVGAEQPVVSVLLRVGDLLSSLNPLEQIGSPDRLDYLAGQPFQLPNRLLLRLYTVREITLINLQARCGRTAAPFHKQGEVDVGQRGDRLRYEGFFSL